MLFYPVLVRGAVTMRTLGLTFLTLGLLVAAVPAATAQDACQTAFTLVGKEDLNWYLESGTAPNPTLTGCPDETITFTLEVEGGVPHNFAIQGVAGAPPATDPFTEGDTQTYEFTAPASGSATYICTIHPSTMKGTINFASTSGGNGGGNGENTNDSPGFGIAFLALAAVGAALVLRRK